MPDAVPAGTPMGSRRRAARGARRGAHRRRPRPPRRGGRAGAAGEGDVLDSCGTAEAFVRASAPLAARARSRAPWRAASASAGTPCRAARRCSAPTGPGARAARRRSPGSASTPEERGPVEEAALARRARRTGGRRRARARRLPRGARRRSARIGADILAHMAAVAAPARRLVVTGGWAAGAGRAAVKERHLGAVRAGSAGRSAAARAAPRSPPGGRRDCGPIDDAPCGRSAGGDAEWPSRCWRHAASSRASAASGALRGAELHRRRGRGRRADRRQRRRQEHAGQDAVRRPPAPTAARSASRAAR